MMKKDKSLYANALLKQHQKNIRKNYKVLKEGEKDLPNLDIDKVLSL